MEDAHIAQAQLGDKKAAIFGVFDGHGGAEVAKFCQNRMANVMLELDEFRKGAYRESLVQGKYACYSSATIVD